MNAPTIAIIDYGYGNIFSVKRAVEHVGGRALVITDPNDLEKKMPTIDKIILPGQGAFPACRLALEPFLKNLLPAVLVEKKPLLGICVGMQLLATTGFEFKEVAGLGLLQGVVKDFKDIWGDAGDAGQKNLTDEVENKSVDDDSTPKNSSDEVEKTSTDAPQKNLRRTLPQMAWNKVQDKKNHPLMAGIDNGDFFYFVHGFAFADYDESDVVASTHYGIDYPMVMARGNIAGIQCHPEKSQKAGLQFLKNFMAWGGTATHE